MFEHGQRVTIDRKYLQTEDQKIFAKGFVVEYKDATNVVVELAYLEERVEVPESALKIDTVKKKKKKA